MNDINLDFNRKILSAFLISELKELNSLKTYRKLSDIRSTVL